MSKQKLEQYLKNSLKQLYGVWFIKLQNSHYSASPADFIVLTHDKRYLIECKQIGFKNIKSSFSFDRLTQEDELIKFENGSNNYSYLLLMYWNGRLKNSYVYFIPIQIYLEYKNMLLEWGIKSISVEFLEKHLYGYKILINKNILGLNLIY